MICPALCQLNDVALQSVRRRPPVIHSHHLVAADGGRAPSANMRWFVQPHRRRKGGELMLGKRLFLKSLPSGKKKGGGGGWRGAKDVRC